MTSRRTLSAEDALRVEEAARRGGGRLELLVARMLDDARREAGEVAVRGYAEQVMAGLRGEIVSAMTDARGAGRGEGLVAGAVVGAREALDRFETLVGGGAVLGMGAEESRMVRVAAVREVLQGLVDGLGRDQPVRE